MSSPPDTRPDLGHSGSKKLSQRKSNNNPKGKNQYKDCPPPDDSRIPELLRVYHRRGIYDRKRISKLLLTDHGITMSQSTVARRRRELGLHASGLTTVRLPDSVKRQLILDQMTKDPSAKIGSQTVKLRIFRDTGIDITRDWITNEMRSLAPEAFASRRPVRRKTCGGAPISGSHPPIDSLPPLPDSRDYSRPADLVPANQDSCAARTPTSTSDGFPSQLHYYVARPVPPVSSTDSFDSMGTTAHVDIAEPSSSVNRGQSLALPLDRPFPDFGQPLITMDRATRSDSAGLDVLEGATSEIQTLTRFLNNVDVAAEGCDAAAAYDKIIKCMEAAAMLERQLSRIASRLQPERHSS